MMPLLQVRCGTCGEGVDLRRTHIQIRHEHKPSRAYHADRKCTPSDDDRHGGEIYWVLCANGTCEVLLTA